jgi:homocitrate synthase NifV
MFHITDRTLSALDNFPLDVSALTQFLKLLIQTEPDVIELSQKMYNLLSPLPKYSGFIVRNGEKAICEILLNDIQDLNTAVRFKDCERVRIQGLDGILTKDYLNSFAQLRDFFSGEIEFCPTDNFHFAAALAVEWLTSGGAASSGAASGVNRIVTSFGGVGGFAPTEEVIMALKLAGLRKSEKTYSFFPEMTSLLNKITAKPVRRNKPILGRRIFYVESGIHVDGILKDPKCYEPFPPETVGLKRKIVIGNKSGTASIKAKLAELGISCDEKKISAVLEGVRIKSEKKRGALNDLEFVRIVKECVA